MVSEFKCFSCLLRLAADHPAIEAPTAVSADGHGHTPVWPPYGAADSRQVTLRFIDATAVFDQSYQ
jgi:hypothetical protein